MSGWITAQAAAERLGVKPQTLYAYVSRGHVAARPSEEDPRQSVYAAADIAALVQRRRGGRARKTIAARAIAWGDPVLESAITTVREGRLIYRGADAVALSAHATLEETARLLIGVAPEEVASGDGTRASMTVAADASSPKTRAALYLATRATTGAPCLGRRPVQLAGEALDLVAGFGAAVAGQDIAGRPVHVALARLWKLKPAHRDLVRRALVLVADHELNPSTFAARVAASTGAPLAAAALAGFATLCGPLHGEASARAVLFLETAQREGAHAAINATLARAERPPATGHALYPEGDPRAAALLAALPLSAAVADAIRAAEATAAARANIDMALAALTVELGLPRDAPFLIFACGRMAGWLAHAIEQTTTGRIIRPRATYVGP